MATRERISRDLKQRIYAAALKKASQQPSPPSWQDVSLQEVTIKSEFINRIEKVRFMKKIRPVLRATLVSMIVMDFMRSVRTFLDRISIQEEAEEEDSNPLSVEPRQSNNNSKSIYPRSRKESRFNYGMFVKFNDNSELRNLVNRLMTLRIQSIIEEKQEKITKASQVLTVFGRRVARRRVIDLCLLTANLNQFIAQKYAGKATYHNLISKMPETSKVLAKQDLFLAKKKHLRLGFLLKHRVACLELLDNTPDVSAQLFGLLKTLVKELLPFSLDWSSLHFDTSYFLLKKATLTKGLIKEDIRAKMEAVEEIYRHKSQKFAQDVVTYERQIQEFLSQKTSAVQHKRTSYLFDQSHAHISKMTNSLKHNHKNKEGSFDFLPYGSKSWIFFFAETIRDKVAPTVHLKVDQKTVLDFLELYNRLLKKNMQAYIARNSELKRLTAVKTEAADNSDSSSDN